mmetsp:Transcript_5390/g.8298  ORF Transcript_5390/g.8298 Transcript_5390/m.8298 type:complete len:110 (+) Transcript_5390:132-461(+)
MKSELLVQMKYNYDQMKLIAPISTKSGIAQNVNPQQIPPIQSSIYPALFHGFCCWWLKILSEKQEDGMSYLAPSLMLMLVASTSASASGRIIGHVVIFTVSSSNSNHSL